MTIHERRSQSTRVLALVSAVAWLIAPIAWYTSTVLERSRPWEGLPLAAYLLGTAAVLAAGATMLATVLMDDVRTRSATTWVGVGLLILALGLSVIAAWALPAWAALYGVGMLWLAASRRVGTFGWIVSVAFLASTAAFFTITTLKLGTPDTYGDYPAASATALLLATVGASIGMFVRFRHDARDTQSPVEATAIG